MTTTEDLSRYRFIPGVSEVGDIDLDKVVIHDQHGNRITEATLDQEYEEMAKQYPGLRPGGKSLSGDGSHSPVLRTVVSKDTQQRVKQSAHQAGMSVSKYLRRVVEEHHQEDKLPEPVKMGKPMYPRMTRQQALEAVKNMTDEDFPTVAPEDDIDDATIEEFIEAARKLLQAA